MQDKNPLDQVIGVDDAAKMWGMTPGAVKNMCARGKIRCKKIGKTWVVDKNQPHPKGNANDSE